MHFWWETSMLGREVLFLKGVYNPAPWNHFKWENLSKCSFHGAKGVIKEGRTRNTLQRWPEMLQTSGLNFTFRASETEKEAEIQPCFSGETHIHTASHVCSWWRTQDWTSLPHWGNLNYLKLFGSFQEIICLTEKYYYYNVKRNFLWKITDNCMSQKCGTRFKFVVVGIYMCLFLSLYSDARLFN